MQIISKDEAIRRGLNFFFTGKACKRNHISKRYISGACIECQKEKVKQYSEKNKEKEKERKRLSHQKHKAKHLEMSKEWQKSNFDQST